MRLRRLIVVLASVASTSVLAASDYVSTVQTPYTPRADVKRVAMMPITCPPDVDCGDLEERVGELLAKRSKLEILPPAQARDVMQKAGISKLDYETRYILAESLRVDGFATVDIQNAGVEQVEGKVVRLGATEVTDAPTSVKHVKMVLQLATKDSTTLLQVTGEAALEGSMRSIDGIAERTVKDMFEKAFPEED
ncbi:MAG TPA: hypothetical protein VJS42_13930 [Steroidobacteraceae bacterium]|nr:hypothetical protein [Steroidobacteraceae bacterium]